MVSVGRGSRLPSTIAYSSRPSSTAAKASTDSGKRRLRGLVALGLNRMTMTRRRPTRELLRLAATGRGGMRFARQVTPRAC